jgi:hypothetical protein
MPPLWPGFLAEETPEFIARGLVSRVTQYADTLKTPFFGALVDYAMMTIGISRPRLRIMSMSAAALPSSPRLPQSTTRQPTAESVCTAIEASSTRRARTTGKAEFPFVRRAALHGFSPPLHRADVHARLRSG